MINVVQSTPQPRQSKSARYDESFASNDSYYSDDEVDGRRDEDTPANVNGVRRWASDDNKFWSCSATYDRMLPGVYTTAYNQSVGILLEKQIIETDEIISLPDSISEEILAEIQQFYDLKDTYAKMSMLYKRGLLLWGDPGSGKTTIIQSVIQRHINDGGIVILGDDPGNLSNALQMVRRVEPNRMILVVLEDFEDILHKFGESEYISILDGEIQINNIVYIATTNYPEKIDKRFVDRPSRFDKIYKVAMPGEELRRHFIKAKNPTITEPDLEQWVKETDGLGISHIKELVISVCCFGKTFDDTIKVLKEMRERKLDSQDALEERVKTGF